MDALELLKTDHERVLSLFAQIRAESGKQQKKLLFENIQNDLEIHAFIEETVFYPAFAAFPELSEIIARSFHEHHAVKEMLHAIDQMPMGTPDFDQKIEGLIASVQKHISEEENDLFPRIQKSVKKHERELLGRRLLAAKQERSEAA